MSLSHCTGYHWFSHENVFPAVSFSTDVELDGDDEDDVEVDAEDDLDGGAEVMVVLVRYGIRDARRLTTGAGLWLGMDGDAHAGLLRGAEDVIGRPGLKNAGVVTEETNRQDGMLRV